MPRSPAETAQAEAPGGVSGVLAVAHLTFTEARRRRILTAALVLGGAFVALFGVGLYFMAQDIREWLEALGLGKYGDAFVEQEVTLEDVAELTESDLIEMIRRTANGRNTAAEALGHREFSMTKLYRSA